MIRFKERVDHQFPIGGNRVCLAFVQVVRGEAEGVEILAQHRDLGEILLLVVRIPDQPAAFEIAEPHQRMRVLVDPGEAIGARQAEQAAVRAIGPGVIGTDDPRRGDGFFARPVKQARPAVAADIGHDMRLTLSIAAEDQRDAIAVMRDREVVLGEHGRGGEQQRQLVEQFGLFGLEPLGVGIDRRGEGFDLGAERRLAAKQGIGERELTGGRARKAWCIH